jgi:outer membrane protein
MENTKSSQVSVVLSIIALIGLSVLYVLFFNSKKETRDSQPVETINLPSVSSSEGAIAFVNSDLVLAKYKLVDKLAKELERERKRKSDDITSKQEAYQKDAAYLQEQVQKQSISEQSAQQIYEQLMATQQDLYDLQDQYTMELSRKEVEMNMVLLDSIRKFLLRYNRSANFDYVLSYNDNGGILFAKDTFDITPQVIQGINKEYDIKFPPPPPKK